MFPFSVSWPPAVQQHQDGAAAKSQRYFARPNELCKFNCQFNRWQRLRRRQLAFWCVCVSVFFFLPYFSLSPRTNNMLEVDDFIWNVGSAAQRVELIARLNAIWKRSKCNSNWSLHRPADENQRWETQTPLENAPPPEPPPQQPSHFYRSLSTRIWNSISNLSTLWRQQI